MTFVSYAQNCEDVMLHRALRGVEHGFYIDVGAAHPEEFSVTKAFYDRGWHGVDVDPDPDYARQLREARPRDVVVQAALGRTPGRMILNRIPGTGLSTLDADIATRHAEAGFTSEPLGVEVSTLAEICRAHSQGDIHFLKIDVEGAERLVLEGADFGAYRPWIVLVEATEPSTPTPNYQNWEPILHAAGYSFVWFDGLNRFYLAQEREAELGSAFQVPPNVFDEFVRAETVALATRADAADARRAEAEVRARQAEERATEAEVRTRQAEERTAEAEARTRQAEERTTEAETRTRQAEERTTEAETRARQAEERTTEAEARARQAEERTAEAEAREADIAAAQSVTLAEIAALRASIPWRLTAPLRGIAGLFKHRTAAPNTLPLDLPLPGVKAFFSLNVERLKRRHGSDSLRYVLSRLANPLLSRLTDRVANRIAARERPAEPPSEIPAAPPAVPPAIDAGRDTALAWGLKLYGSRLARELYISRMRPLIDTPITTPRPVPLSSKLCEERDIESDWFVHWCRELKLEPIYHRKVWEECFALQAMWEAGLMREGVSALCFGAGEEPLPSYLASRGLDVLATDLAADDAAAAGWIATGQHATLERLFRPELVAREAFERRVQFRPVDMNAIPEDLEGRFDMCWSLCSLEHVGTTELACRFVERSMDCLKPGGVAIHTTEFNLTSETETVTSGWCVLFTRPQIEALCERLRSAGHQVAPVSFHTGSEPLDQFIDLPPFPATWQEWTSPNAMVLPDAPHLRLALLGHVSTSIALIIRKAG